MAADVDTTVAEHAATRERIVDVDGLTVIHQRRGGGRGERFAAVDGVSIHLDAGEIVSVVGESGSGKTSLAMALTALGAHTSGRVELLGRDLSTLRPRQLRALRPEVQVIFQDPHGSLDPRQSVKAGFKELRGLQPQRTSWTDDAGLLAQVRLSPDLLDRYPHQLSGGQAQRVCIARALLMRPRVLVADEPTSGLDVSVQAEVLRLLLELRDGTGVSILFISHDLSVVRRISDRVYVMRSGTVVEEGLCAQVLDAPQHPYTRELIAAVPGQSLGRRPRIALEDLAQGARSSGRAVAS
ncbi:MAG TPA: ATP-binding cassette domain-containing protein [Conexibacter sp.]|nr:ATP-binding cassette domain-containing protein [Conexibacter sp.]